MKYLLFAILLFAILIAAGCVGGDQKTVVTPLQTTSILPTPTAAPTTIPTQSTQDPIIGSWSNGMVFFTDGSVGTDGTTSWKVNPDKKNSYFVISDVKADWDNSRNVISTVWTYIPGSDSILKRGSSESVSWVK